MATSAALNQKYEVLTIDGFKSFDYVTYLEKSTIKLDFGITVIECTSDHLFYSITQNRWIEAIEIKLGESIRSLNGSATLLSVVDAGTQYVSDLVNVADTHSFIANDLDAHNCL